MRRAYSGRKTFRALMAVWAAMVLMVLSVTFGGGVTASAFAETPITVGGNAIVTNTDGDPIRVRLGPGTEFGQIAAAYEGQTVSIVAGPLADKAGMRWFMVQAPAGTGWMMAQYLRASGAPAAAPRSATPRLTGFAVVANTNRDPLRLRSSPSTVGKILVLLEPGARAAVQDGPVADSAGTAWYKITAKGVTGWAMAMYLAQAPGSSPPSAPPSVPAPATPASARVSTEPAAQKQTPPQAEPAVAAKPAAPATATAVATATPGPTEKPKATPTAATRSSNTSTMGQYRQWVEEARIMYPYKQTTDKMWSVMMCESGGNARASGGGGQWLGLFQYAPATWGGSWNPYRGESIWDAKLQIFATAKAWSIGMQSHWSCYYITPGR